MLASVITLQAQELHLITPAGAGLDDVRLARLDAMLQSFIDEERRAGSVTLVMRDGRVVFSAAKGQRDRERQVPMTEDTLFRIASQTKAVVSVGILLLHERGGLQISDPLSRYFPEWENARVAVDDGNGGYTLQPLSRPITLRDLLTHTAGVGYGLNGHGHEAWAEAGISGWYLASRTEPIGDTVRRMAALPLQAQPGTQWTYGYGTDILGAVIELASGKNLADFLRDEIFRPLGMRNTRFYLDESEAERLAVVYRHGQDGGLEPAPQEGSMQGQGDYVRGPKVSFSGGAGLLSTAGDYARFLQMLLNGGELSGTRLLSPRTVELMTVDHLNGISFQPGTGMGLGVSVLKDPGARGTYGSVGEYGWRGAYHSIYWVDPKERLVVVYLSQLLNVDAFDDFSILRSGVYSALMD